MILILGARDQLRDLAIKHVIQPKTPGFHFAKHDIGPLTVLIRNFKLHVHFLFFGGGGVPYDILLNMQRRQ